MVSHFLENQLRNDNIRSQLFCKPFCLVYKCPKKNLPYISTNLQNALSISVQFIEDMDESELQTAMKMPAGLTNLGNTCYMNATVQV